MSGFLDQVPDAPLVPLDVSPEVVSGVLTASDINLTWWCPTGGVYNLLTFANGYMPWWACIALMTLAARVCLTPVVIANQKNQARMSEVMPELMKAQENYNKAMRIGNDRDSEFLVIVYLSYSILIVL